METSDSEYFESADEEFYSDDESKENKPKSRNVPEFPVPANKLDNCREDKNTNTQYMPDVNENRREENIQANVKVKENLDVEIESSIVNKQCFNVEKVSSLKLTEDVKADDDTVNSGINVKKIKSYNPNVDKQNKTELSIQLKESSTDQLLKFEEIIKTVDNLEFDDKNIDSTKKSREKLDTKVSVSNENVPVVETNLNKKLEATNKGSKPDDNLWNDDEGWGIEEDSDDGNLWKKDEINWGNDEHNKGKKISDSKKEKEINEVNMWENDEWESIDNVQNKENPTDSHKGNKTSISESDHTWGGWGSWGVSSIISSATQSVSTLTNSVSHGISTVLETGIGVPDPEALAKINQVEKEEIEKALKEHNILEETQNKKSFGFGNLSNIVSEVSKLVESTSTKVISGGLDTLETIGKKTMEVLQEGDPGLKKKRAFLQLDQQKPVLSQVLREAKEKAEQENKILQEKHFAKKMNYESLFDDYQGLVHLEALEMLSKQCDIKLQTLSESCTGETLTEMQETMEQVKELCELPDEDEEEHISLEEIKDRLRTAVEEVDINITYDKFISTWEEAESWLNSLKLNVCDEHELHQQAIETLAQLTAIAVEQFHKAGALLLIKEHRSTADEADSLVRLTTTVTSLIGIVAAKFSDKLNTKVSESSNKEDINSLITNVFFEAANSSSYIQDAFQLLVPVLQVGAV